MLPLPQRQESLSRAYVRAVAARAGLICTDITQDYGIDMCLRLVSQLGRRYIDSGVQLDLQLKSTTIATLTDTDVIYDLEVRAFDVLRKENPSCPRVLVLLVLPADEGEWVTQSMEELILRRCAFWVSLRGAPPATSQRTTRIRLPRSQVFSSEAVLALMTAWSEGGTP